MALVPYYPVTGSEVRAHSGPRPGAVALLRYLREVSSGNPGRLPATDGIYNRRRVRGGLSWSSHASGRGLDFGVNANTPEGLQLGNFILFCLMMDAVPLGIQYVIWNGYSYKAGEAPRKYNGVSPHKDHLHIEMTPHAADNVTYEWVKGVIENP